MLTELLPIRLLLRWSAQLENSSIRMGFGMTMKRRFSGDRKNERAEAKLLLLASVLMWPWLISDMLGYERGWVWHLGWWISVAWAALVLSFMIAALWRGAVRGIRLWRRRRR